jgi:hypothetical protein
MAFGESINQFYSAITRDLSFYEYIPLLIAVTLVLVVLIIFGTSFLSLLLFNYELNFFHLIKFRKTYDQPQIDASQREKINMLEQKQTAMLEILHYMKKENRALNARNKKYMLEMSKPLTGATPTPHQQSIQSSTTSIDSSIMVKNIEAKSTERIYSLEPMESSELLNDDTEKETEYEQECSDDEKEENLNESLKKNFEIYKEKNIKKEKYYNEKIAELRRENMKLKNKFNQIESHLILEKQIELQLNNLKNNQILNGENKVTSTSDFTSSGVLSASMKPNNFNNHHHKLGASTNTLKGYNEDSDDEGDIYVILDESH